MNFKIILMLTTISLTFDVSAKNKNYGNAKVLDVTSIYDGDTFRANIKGFPAVIGEHMSIRINGIDTPELRGKCETEKQLARKAKQFTVEHLRAAKNITLKNIKRGKYFRLIADVYVDGISLGELLIKYKHAVIYQGKAKKTWC
jgi:micrococcal nuclease